MPYYTDRSKSPTNKAPAAPAYTPPDNRLGWQGGASGKAGIGSISSTPTLDPNNGGGASTNKGARPEWTPYTPPPAKSWVGPNPAVPQNPYDPTNDMTIAGARERIYNAYEPYFMDPNTNTGNWLDANSGQLSNPTMIEGFAQNAITSGYNPYQQDNYAKFAKSAHGVGADANFDAYYNDAERRAQEKLRTSMAAQGQYGSSTYNDMTAEMLQTMEGQRARDLADYRLKASQENRGWETLGGNLAKDASDEEKGWTDLYGSLAGTASTVGLGRYDRGLEGAKNADTAIQNKIGLGAEVAGGYDTGKLGRNQFIFDSLRGIGNDDASDMGKAYAALSDQDQALFDDQVKAFMGKYAETTNANSQDRAQMGADLSTLLSFLKKK